MLNWFYIVGEDQVGPISHDDLQALIKTGVVRRDTFVWKAGMDDWKQAGEHSETKSAFLTPPPLPASLLKLRQSPAKRPRPAFTAPERDPGAELASRPWARFWARTIDNLLLAPAFGFGIGLWSANYAPDVYLQLIGMNDLLFGILLLPLVSVALAICMIATGSTPGKAIAKIHVSPPSDKGRILFFLSRETKVWIYGLGLGIPFVALFTQIHQYKRLAAGKPASYDNTAVTALPSSLRLGIAIAIGLCLFAANMILRVGEQQSTRNLVSAQTWVNPVSNKPATIGGTWQMQEMETNSGRAFYFASRETLSEAIFGYEQYPSGIEAVRYAEAIAKALSSEISITSEWRPVTIQRRPGLRATGRSLRSGDSGVELTIVVSGQNAWRTLIFTRGSSTGQSAENDRFLQAVMSTTN